jgi:hypothetical protein
VFAKTGSCKKGDNCPYPHEPPATPAKSEAAPKGKAKAEPKKAAPALVLHGKGAGADSDNESVCSALSAASTTDEVDRYDDGTVPRPRSKRRVKFAKDTKFTRGKAQNYERAKTPKYVDMSEFEHQDRQMFVDYHTNIARARARLMEEQCDEGAKKAIVNLSGELDMIVTKGLSVRLHDCP